MEAEPTEKLPAQPAEAGDIIQLTDEKHPWYPCLLIVSEPKAWGVQAVCLAPSSNMEPLTTVQYWNRLKSGQYEVVGRARVMPG
jgi:hypothetical protein